MVRKYDQKWRDKNRLTYNLSFPSQLDGESVGAFLRSIAGTLKSTHHAVGVGTVAFEVWSTPDGIKHYLKVPWQHADYVVGQLRSLVPGIRVTPEDNIPHRVWTRIVEIGMSHGSRQLRIVDARAVSASILASIGALQAGETLMMQWVISPTVPHPPPQYERTTRRGPTLIVQEPVNRDVISDRRAKLEHPNLLAVLRVGAVADTLPRANHLIYRVRSSLASTRSSGTKFVRRLISQRRLQERIDRTVTPLRLPMQLSTPELVALLAWPVGNPMIAGLPMSVGKQFPPVGTIPSSGIVFGTSTFPGNERQIAVGYPEALMHTWVGGSTGTGKSAVLANMARQIMNDGYGLIVIETEGSLYQNTLDYVPERRINDVVLLDIQETQAPASFGVLDQGNASAIDQIIGLFNHKYQTSMWADEHLYFGLRTIQEAGLGFTDLVPLMAPKPDEVRWVEEVTRNLKDTELRRWWQLQGTRDAKDLQRRADPILSRIWQLASRPELRLIMGQSKSTVRIDEILRENKILLVNLKGTSQETAALAGTLIFNTIWQATKNTPKEIPTYVILDEFADLMDLPVDTETVLAQARKHKVGLILANQHLGQLPQRVRDGVIANTRTKVVLKTTSDDARLLMREMGSNLEHIDFTTLQLYEAITQVLTPTGVSPPVSIRTSPPARYLGNAAKVIYQSRSKYGRPVEDIRREIDERRTPKAGERPSVGSL